MLLFVLSSNFLIISQLFLFVNNFFIFLLNFLKFVAAVFSGELYNIKPSNKCQQLFSTFFKCISGFQGIQDTQILLFRLLCKLIILTQTLPFGSSYALKIPIYHFHWKSDRSSPFLYRSSLDKRFRQIEWCRRKNAFLAIILLLKTNPSQNHSDWLHVFESDLHILA